MRSAPTGATAQTQHTNIACRGRRHGLRGSEIVLDAGRSVVVPVAGRSQAKCERLAALGVPVVQTASEMLAHSGLALSMVPPAEARQAAETVAVALRAVPQSLTYVDCNAVSPETARQIRAIVCSEGAAFINAGIIGGPPRDNARSPIVVVSGEYLAPMLKSACGRFGRPLARFRVGSASALKLSYAG